jgi:hypothetical protein
MSDGALIGAYSVVALQNEILGRLSEMPAATERGSMPVFRRLSVRGLKADPSIRSIATPVVGVVTDDAGSVYVEFEVESTPDRVDASWELAFLPMGSYRLPA